LSTIERDPLYAECIRRAAQLLGGYAALGKRLGRSPQVLERWARGEGDAGEMVFLEIVDILLSANNRAVSPPQPGDATTATRNRHPGV
jgi:hypothetical protein